MHWNFDFMLSDLFHVILHFFWSLVIRAQLNFNQFYNFFLQILTVVLHLIVHI